jgi:uncharacterized protein YciI
MYFIHPPRTDFARTMTAEEEAVWGVHFERLQRLLAEGTLVLAGPTLGEHNTGIAIFEARDEAAVRTIMEEDPVIAGASPAASCGRSTSRCSGGAARSAAGRLGRHAARQRRRRHRLGRGGAHPGHGRRAHAR